MKYSRKVLRDLFGKFGFRFYEAGLYNVNIFGVRASATGSNAFDDIMCVAFDTEAGWYTCSFPITTDPGKTVLGQEKMGHEKGTAILPASTLKSSSQYRFKLGMHKGKYPALVQSESFKIVRDVDKNYHIHTRQMIQDKLLAWDVDVGFFGINIHHATAKGFSTSVNDWSWGCQVFQSIFDWEKFMAIINHSASIYGERFTYTLFDESDIMTCLGTDLNGFHHFMNNNRLTKDNNNGKS